MTGWRTPQSDAAGGADFAALRRAVLLLSEGRQARLSGFDLELLRALDRLQANSLLEGAKRRLPAEAGDPAEVALMQDLREGLADNQFTVAYQPQLNLRSREIDAVEVLCRWTHPVRGRVAPSHFIEPAEDSGDIRQLTQQVLLSVVHDQAELAEAGDLLTIHVNLSARLVTDEAFCRWIVETCAKAKGPIGMEITETAVIADPELALRNLHILVESGIAIAIDDYGSGLSSLAYLKALPARELKIDRAFIAGLSTTARDPLLVRSTIDLAHALQMQVTAEGVEDASALALLRAMGCDRAQGYFISHPLDLGSLKAFLAQHSPDQVDATLERAPLAAMPNQLPQRECRS